MPEFITEQHCTDTHKIFEEQFMSRKSFYGSLWVLIVTFMGLITGSIAWAMNTSNDLSKLTVKQEYQQVQLEQLKVSIEGKLDRIERWTQGVVAIKPGVDSVKLRH